jgi:hypothetical protein
MAQGQRKLRGYSVDEIHNQLAITHILNGTVKLQDKLIQPGRVIAQLISDSTSHEVSPTLVDRMTTGGQVSKDPRRRSGLITLVNADYIELFLETFGSPREVERIYHGKTISIDTIDVPYLKEDFVKMMSGLVDWRDYHSFDELIPSNFVHPHAVYARRGILTTDFFEAFKALEVLEEDDIIISSIALAYKLTERQSHDVYDELQLQEKRLTINGPRKPIEAEPVGPIANTILGLMLLENVAPKDFARNCGITLSEFKMVTETNQPLCEELISRLGAGLSLIRPQWSAESLARMELSRISRQCQRTGLEIG